MDKGVGTKFNDGTELLTVRKLIIYLMQEDMDSYVAIDQNGYANKTIIMTECYKSGDYYMKCTEEQKRDMVKVLVIGAIISKDEIKGTGEFSNIVHLKKRKH